MSADDVNVLRTFIYQEVASLILGRVLQHAFELSKMIAITRSVLTYLAHTNLLCARIAAHFLNAANVLL